MRRLFDFGRESRYNGKGGGALLAVRAEKLLDGFLMLCLLFAAFLLVRTAAELSTVSAGERQMGPSLVIDPGHGGFDGGAIAFNGVKESDINLAIGLKLCDLAGLYGIPTAMTRTDDRSRTAYENYSEHEDLAARAAFANAVPNGVLISIHQNFFPTSQPSGAQVLYAPGRKSKELGETLQALLVSQLQPANRRLAEPAPKSLFLTSHVNCPAVLVECGFLSNFSDLELLTQDAFQSSVAAVLLAAFLQCFSSSPGL